MCGRRLKTRWTLAKSAVQFCWMWRAYIGLLLLAAPAWADENATAYEALRVVGREFGRDALHQIVSITGTKGNPQPENGKLFLKIRRAEACGKWKLLMETLRRTARLRPTWQDLPKER